MQSVAPCSAMQQGGMDQSLSPICFLVYNFCFVAYLLPGKATIFVLCQSMLMVCSYFSFLNLLPVSS